MENKMSKFEENAQVVSQKELAPGIFDLTIQTAEIAKHAVAGQFISVYCADKTKLLPRPISLCGIDREAGTLRLVYRVTGEKTGTEEFSKLSAGDTVRVLGPLGTGFTVQPGKKAFLIGGGIGVPPMLQLAKEMGQTEFTIVMGYRNADTFLLDEFEKQGNVLVATEDGSVGTRGNVLDAIRENGAKANVIYACGPLPMLRALKTYAAEQGMDCFISMEERMACGIGACLACVCKTKDVDAHSNVKNKRICKEGPVFDAREVELS
jgi:dihydroorotate dehydrogenase electron transfer subunit